MPRVIWTPRALQDVARLHRFLAPKNRDAARRAVRAIRAGVKVLGSSPEIGRPAPEMAPDFRERIIPFGDSAYLALYHYDGEMVTILAVRHGREVGYWFISGLI
jgi:plasmid stabilization system protein ParE